MQLIGQPSEPRHVGHDGTPRMGEIGTNGHRHLVPRTLIDSLETAYLVDDDQDRVVVAVEPDLAHPLDVPRGLALAPQLRARTRPVVRLARALGRGQRLAVHPRERQHPSARRVLRDRGHEAVRVEPDAIEPGDRGRARGQGAPTASRTSMPARFIAAFACPTVYSP